MIELNDLLSNKSFDDTLSSNTGRSSSIICLPLGESQTTIDIKI